MPDRLPPPGGDPRAVRQLRGALVAARFDAEHVGEVLGAEGPNLTPSPSQVPALLRSLEGDHPLITLIRLFVAAAPVGDDLAAAALAPLPLEDAAAMNLLRVDGGDALVHPAIRIVPAGPVLVASDLTPDPSRLAHDVVIGVSSTSWTLAHLTVRRAVETALDVGTGCGIQALLAARHAARVTATDTNVRALEFARFSAAVNQLENIEFLAGDLFNPVEDRRFDLVVANPPFVISPEDSYQYRDGGQPRDELSRRVVEGAAAVLTPGGFAHALIGWVHEPGGDWSAPPREWVAGLGCDAWVFHFESKEPDEYAVDWNKPLEPDPERHAAAVGEWLDYYARHRIEAIAYGAVVLRRQGARSGHSGEAGQPWVRVRSVGTIPVAPAGEQVAQLFAAGDFLDRAADPEGFLNRRFSVDDGLRIEQVVRLGDGNFEVEQALLHLEQGLPMVVEIDGYTAELLAALQREGVLARAMEAVDGTVPDDVGAEDLRAATIELVAGLVELGFVHPA